jgi:hypothetical protein
MIQINKSERKQLESLGKLYPTKGHYEMMNVCSRRKKSKGHSTYIEDQLVIWVNPDKYRSAMKGYMPSERIEYIIRNVLRGSSQY